MNFPTSRLRLSQRSPMRWLWAPVWLSLQACTHSAEPPTEPTAALWGSQWTLQAIGNQPVIAASKAALYFWEEGRIAGNGSCNRFFGTATMAPDRSIAFGPIGATKMACPGEAMAQESRYLGALQKAQRYERQGDTLLIHAEGMDQPLRFTLAK